MDDREGWGWGYGLDCSHGSAICSGTFDLVPGSATDADTSLLRFDVTIEDVKDRLFHHLLETLKAFGVRRFQLVSTDWPRTADLTTLAPFDYDDVAHTSTVGVSVDLQGGASKVFLVDGPLPERLKSLKKQTELR
ncbi:hypothetical protein PG993_011053 [Apiospora rasikravindrae]|uniref:Uncharacterized protein n=1 Tax=Apiospora rasikravindrae TaxID=990691 RepID=A0ABR1SD43_9PEZI